MAFDAFLVVKDSGKAVKVKGETQDAFFKNLGAFEISEFSFGAENTLNITSATGGAGAGKATFKEFTVKKQTDSASGQMLILIGTGGHYKSMQLYIKKSGGAADKGKSGKPYLVFAFGMVALKSIEWSGSTGDDVPSETVVFEFGELMVNYFPQKEDGSLGAGQPLGWSKLNNTANPGMVTAADVAQLN
jgi:type VI secretion system secreted protein Hcp